MTINVPMQSAGANDYRYTISGLSRFRVAGVAFNISQAAALAAARIDITYLRGSTFAAGVPISEVQSLAIAPGTAATGGMAGINIADAVDTTAGANTRVQIALPDLMLEAKDNTKEFTLVVRVTLNGGDANSVLGPVTLQLDKAIDVHPQPAPPDSSRNARAQVRALFACALVAGACACAHPFNNEVKLDNTPFGSLSWRLGQQTCGGTNGVERAAR